MHSTVTDPAIGSSLGGLFLIIIIVAIISVICWYKRIGICAKLRKRTRPRTTDRAQDNEIKLNTVVCNPCTLGTTSNTDTIQSASTSHQTTLPSTTVSITPHCTGNTLPSAVPEATPNRYVQRVTPPTQDGDNPNEAHGAGTNGEETYEVVGGPVVNDDTVHEVVKSGGDTPSHFLYDHTD